MPTIIIDGQVAGTWKRTIKNKGIVDDGHNYEDWKKYFFWPW
jgi:hypothetical protein